MSDLRSDATALAALATLLGPERAVGPVHHHAVLPSPARPRYVLPASGHVRGAHIRPSGSGWRERATRAAVVPALRLGLGRVLPGGLAIADGTAADPSLRRHLAALLDAPDLELSIALGAPRPNRKPVLQALGADGTTLAWVKVGVDAHTDRLVAHEIEALTTRGSSDAVRTPEVLAAGSWQGHPLLALAHMELTETLDDLVVTEAAARALAGPTTPEPVTAGRWWEGLRAIDRTIDVDGHLTGLLDSLEGDLAPLTWPFGGWHGDLAPWNATWDGRLLTAWDWERSTAPVPLGLDLVHNRIQVAILRDGADLTTATRVAATRDADVLVALGYPVEQHPLLVAAYLVTLRARYLDDAVHGSLGPGAPIAAAIDLDPTLGRRAATS